MPTDLIAVFSYIFLRGKCKNCKEKVSGRYPLIETLNALLYLRKFNFYAMWVEILKLYWNLLIL